MAFLVSNDTANWINEQRRKGDLTATPRRGHILGNGGGVPGNVSVCIITGGNALQGYTARAYQTMTELRRDTGGTAGTPTTIFPCEIGLDAYFPEGTIVLCHDVICRVTAGSENTPSA